MGQILGVAAKRSLIELAPPRAHRQVTGCVPSASARPPSGPAAATSVFKKIVICTFNARPQVAVGIIKLGPDADRRLGDRLDLRIDEGDLAPESLFLDR